MESLHPLVIHFPIALLLSALLVDLLALAFKRPGWHRIALWNLTLGALGAGAAVLSGRQAAAIAKHSFEIWEVMERHEHLGYATLSLSALLAVYRWWKQDQLTGRARLVTIIGMLILATTISVGAYLGGRMVYEFGVGGVFGR